MAIVDRRSLPVAVHVASASPAEVRLIRPTLEDRFLPDYPPRLIGDRAYDSDPLRARLLAKGLVCPHRRGRKLRRYRRRWKIERTMPWLHNIRRLVARYECYSNGYQAFIQMACITICLPRF